MGRVGKMWQKNGKKSFLVLADFCQIFFQKRAKKPKPRGEVGGARWEGARAPHSSSSLEEKGGRYACVFLFSKAKETAAFLRFCSFRGGISLSLRVGFLLNLTEKRERLT